MLVFINLAESKTEKAKALERNCWKNLPDTMKFCFKQKRKINRQKLERNPQTQKNNTFSMRITETIR